MNLSSLVGPRAITDLLMLSRNSGTRKKCERAGKPEEGQWVHEVIPENGGVVHTSKIPPIGRRTFSNWMSSAVGVIVMLVATQSLSAQSLPGRWQGTRSERNAITGGTYTVNFEFEFYGDGTFRQVARLGSSAILRLTGQYSLERGRKQGDPSVTHILALIPQNIEVRPDDQELKLLQMADLPNVDSTEQFVFFYNLAPAGAMTLQNRAGGETWGLKKVVD